MLTAVVIDDEPSLRLLTRYALEDDGSVEIVGEAGDAFHAVVLIDKLQPDVAIIDIHLNGISGIQLIQGLRARRASTRLVAYSSDDNALAAALVAGADAAVLKTGRSEELLLALSA